MNDNDLLEDFDNFIAQRARKKHAEAVAKESAPLTEEENLFNATVGLRIKCGVCGTMHKSSKIELLPALKTCVSKLVMTFKEENRKHYKHETLYPEWTDDQGALKLRYTVQNFIWKMVPNDDIWRATHQKFIGKVDAAIKRVNETFVREINNDVPMNEILGAPSSYDYVRVKLKEFDERVKRDNVDMHAKQLQSAGKVGLDLCDWRTLAPESWKLSDRIDLSRYDGPDSNKPIGSIVINKNRVSVDALWRSFTTIYAHDIFWQAKPKNVEKYVIDVGLWKDKMPALLWTVRAQQGYKYGNRRSSTRHGKPIYGVLFLSTWAGKNYMVHGNAKTVEEALEYNRHEIVARKEDRDE